VRKIGKVTQGGPIQEKIFKKKTFAWQENDPFSPKL